MSQMGYNSHVFFTDTSVANPSKKIKKISGLYDCVRSSTCEEKRDRDGSIDIRYLCMLLSKAGQSNILQGQMKIPKLNAPGSLFHSHMPSEHFLAHIGTYFHTLL